MGQLKTGIVICSRLKSERVPLKPLRKINGVTIIENLVNRLKKTGLPIVLAVPAEDADFYPNFDGDVMVYSCGFDEDPLGRMNAVADKFGFHSVVRVTHDKILVEPEMVMNAVAYFNEGGYEYVFGNYIAGSGFEIIASSALKKAASRYKNVEFISYAIRSVAKRQSAITIPLSLDFTPRFLIDYPEDLHFMEVLFSQVGSSATLFECIRFLSLNRQLMEINRLPELTIYTCAYNEQDHINECMRSVEDQRIFNSIEYVLIDDHSFDSTPVRMARFMSDHRSNVKWIRNEKNLGLASSSNVAIKAARGQYIMRLDADDYFVDRDSAETMLTAIKDLKAEIVYPSNYYGSLSIIQDAETEHHVGGAIFDKRALNHIRFTDGLRGYEGLDLFVRARSHLDIKYIKKPIFFYRQRDDSMSKTNLEERAKLKKTILEKVREV